MQNFIKNNKWSILAAGAVVQIFTGVPAAWGVFQGPVCEDYGFAAEDGCMIFALTIAFFGIGGILGGLAQDKFGPRIAGIIGTVMLAGGFAATGFIKGGIVVFVLSFSLPVGLGCSFLYPAVMSCAQKWYSDKKGLATGIIGGAVGLSGAILTLLARYFTGLWGIRGSFFAFSGLVLVFCGTACIFLTNPPKNEDKNTNKKLKDYTVKQMLKTPQYYMVFSVVALATPAVLLFSPIIVQLGQERGLSESAAHLSIIIGSFGSAVGRILMPILSDKLGRRIVDMGLLFSLAGLSLAFIFADGWLVIAGYTALTLCYSGEAAVIPALGTDLYGFKNAGANYGFLALGMSIGSVAFTIMARMLPGMLSRSIIAIVAAVVGFVILIFIKPTQGKKL